MREVLLIRHAQAKINEERSMAGNGENAAVGHTQSPLTEKGKEQARQLGVDLGNNYSIKPELYRGAVAVSEYLRPQQTAEYAGFKYTHILPLINELEISDEVLPYVGGRKFIEKHIQERWVPDEVQQRATRFLELVRDGSLGYEIFFSHGMFIAGVKMATEQMAPDNEYVFTKDRGYIPLQTEVTVIKV